MYNIIYYFIYPKYFLSGYIFKKLSHLPLSNLNLTPYGQKEMGFFFLLMAITELEHNALP